VSTKYRFNFIINISINELYRHHEITPNAFRVGDVVEAQISFVVIQLRGQRQKMIVIMRALTLLDKGALEVSQCY
jgi:hypothetical protein